MCFIASFATCVRSRHTSLRGLKHVQGFEHSRDWRRALCELVG
jgi:hypothetical protein